MTRSSNILIILIYGLLLALFWVAGYTNEPIALESFTPWAQFIDTHALSYPVVTLALTGVLTVVISFLVTQMTIRRISMMEGSLLPALLFLVISCALCNSIYSLRPLLCVIFIILSINNLLRSTSIKSIASGTVILSGFWASIAILIFPESYTIALVVILGLVVLRGFEIRELLAMVVGMLITPVFITLISYIMDYDMGGYLSSITTHLGEGRNGYQAIIAFENPLQTAFVGILALLLLLSMTGGKRTRTSNSPAERRVRGLFMIFTWILAISLLLSPEHSLYFATIAALPLSIVLASSLGGRKKRILANILYALLIACGLAINFADKIFPLIWIQ